NVLFGFGRPIESSTLDWNLTILSERLQTLPVRLLPIASDSGGSIFCLALSDSLAGAIVFCDLQSVFADFVNRPGLYMVSPSFNAFLSSLEDESVLDDE
ncbi:unnamed protein product, partial [marine sediment metagenome]